MKNRTIYVAVILCMIVSLVPVAISAPVIQATNCLTPPAGTLYVDNPDDGDQCPYCPHYDTISEAITAALDGDTIIVYDGTYHENLDITKPLTIISVNGSGSTFISGDVNPVTINFWANNIHLGAVNQGFDINDDKILAYGDQTGGLIAGNSIVGNTIHDPDQGEAIRFDNGQYDGDTRDNVISGNTIYSCYNGITFDNCVTSYSTYNNTVQGNNISASTYGIYFGNDDSEGDIHGNNISDNTVHGCEYQGIAFENSYDGDETYGQIYGNTVHNNSVYDCEDGILFGNDQLGDVHNNNISNNTVYGCDWGIELWVDWNGNMSDNTIVDNTVHDCGDGIGLYDSGEGYGDVDGNTVDGNEVYNCQYSGIELWSESILCIVENTVSNNTVYDCDYDEDSTGILLYAGINGNVSTNTVDGNEVYDCTNGIMLEGDGGELYGNAVTNNEVYRNSPQEYSSGIYLYTGPGGEINTCTIGNNTVYGWYYGIYSDDNSATTIEDIDFSDNVLYNGSTGNVYGIRTDSGFDLNIRGNNIAYSSEYGICLVGSDYVYITSNMVQNNSEGIYMEDSSYVEISGNDIRDNNPADDTGIAVLDSEDVSVTCNNIEGNGEGLYVYHWDSICVDANNN